MRTATCAGPVAPDPEPSLAHPQTRRMVAAVILARAREANRAPGVEIMVPPCLRRHRRRELGDPRAEAVVQTARRGNRHRSMTNELTISPLSRPGATGRREVKPPGSLHARDLLEDHVDVDGLHQMDVEPCLQRALAVPRLAVSCQRDQPETAAPG